MQLDLQGPCFAPLKSIIKQQLSSMAMGTKFGLNLCYLLEREAGKWGLAAPGCSP